MRTVWHSALDSMARWQAAVVAIGLLCAPGAVQAAVPTTTSIEGTLFSSGGGPAADGNYNVVFSIYKDASGGTAVYSEGPVAVAVKGGLFTHQIGSKTALTPAALAALPTAFLGLKIDQDAELPRQPINSTPFALRAGVAEGVDCTGCIAEKALDPNILKDYTKTAAMTAVAKSGNYADLTGAPTIPVVSAAGKSGNYADLLNLPTLANVAKTGNYADLIGAPVLGKVATTNKYADLTGLPTLAALNTACGTNLVVKGIKADGTLDCATGGGGPIEVKNLPADGIDEISNGMIFNQFNDTFSGATGTKIPDQNPIGISDTIVYPDIGLSQKLTVTLDVSNSDISGLTISLFDPAGVEYVLYKKGATGTAVKTSYPAPTAPVSGDLATWIGKNPKGKWILKVVDTAFLNNTVDGAINSWSITSQTLSSKKIAVAGNMLVSGNATVTGDVTGANISTSRGYRQVVWENDQLDMTSTSWATGRSMVYAKQRADTVLIIDHTEGFNIRGYYGWTGAGYRVLIDGAECTVPGRIELTFAHYSPTINIHSGDTIATHAICKATTAGPIGAGNHTIQAQGRRSYGDGNAWGPYWSYNLSNDGNRIARLGVGEIQDNQ